jgi:hypothetical protein
MLVALLAAAGCDLSSLGKVEKLPDAGDIDLPTSREAVKTALHKLFPDLSDADIATFSAKLDLETLAALRMEIEDIRKVASRLSKALDDLASGDAAKRKDALAAHNDGYPEGIEPLGRAAFYDAESGRARVDLAGVFHDHEPLLLTAANVSVAVDGQVEDITLSCAPAETLDIVLLVDITGSMSSVIGSVRRSLEAFVKAIADQHVRGTLSIVTFQDSVGVNVGFQEPAPSGGIERSPFFKPVPIDDQSGIDSLVRFIQRLEADSGADIPENLAGAVDFARNNVIGLTSKGEPNVIGDAFEDPRGTSAWPKLSSAKQIFVAFTDAPFHADSRTAANSSLKAPFKPRPVAQILATLRRTGTTVHVSDPSWVDKTSSPTGSADEVELDADYWAVRTGGLGEDRIAGYSLIDLDLVVRAENTGLLDIVLDRIIATTCNATFDLPTLKVDAKFDLRIEVDGVTFEDALTPIAL